MSLNIKYHLHSTVGLCREVWGLIRRRGCFALSFGLLVLPGLLGGGAPSWAAPQKRPLTIELHRYSGEIRVVFHALLGIKIQTDEDERRHLIIERNGRSIRIFAKSDVFMREDITLYAPFGSNVKLKTFNGGIQVGVGGHNVEANTLRGDVTVLGAKGAVTLKTVSGSITLKGGDDCDVSTVSGDITLSGVKGQIKVNTVSGSIGLSQCKAARLELQSVSGSVVLKRCELGRAVLKAFSGDLTIHGTTGKSTRLLGTTFSGDIVVHWERGAGVHVQGSTVSGSLTLPGHLSKHKGLPRLSFKSQSGDITWREQGKVRPPSRGLLGRPVPSKKAALP